MRFWLTPHCALKKLETPSVYDIRTDELYELDVEAFDFLLECSSPEGADIVESEFASYCLEEGILTTNKVRTSRPPVRKAPEPSLRYLELQITRRCNLNCAHCYIAPKTSNGSGAELKAADVESVLDQFEEMQGLRLLLTGGEPLMHREFWDINRMLQDHAIRTVLFTNGLLLTEKALGSLNAHEIQVSIDGLEEAHDALRGRGSYGSAMTAAKKALEAGFDVSVSTMVHPGNLGDFHAMDSMFRDMGVRDWTVDVPCTEGNLKENPQHVMEPADAGKYLSYGYGGSIHGGAPGYACGRHLMSVMADGFAAKCAFYSRTPAGSIEEGLESCWSRVRHIKIKDLECAGCIEREECRGGCRYRALTLGSESGKDLYRCGLYGKI